MTLLLAFVLFWALWRRLLGGWLGLPRPVIVLFGALVASFSFGVPQDWVVLSGGLIFATVTVAFWTPGHNFLSDRALLLRYGPIIGLPWMVARRWWPTHWVLGSFIDGWTAAAELGAGALFGVLTFILHRLIA